MKEKIQVLRVVSKRAGFRRAGIAFGSEPVDLTRDQIEELGEEKFKSIINDPSLVCVQAEIEVPDKADEAGVGDSGKQDASAQAKAGKK